MMERILTDSIYTKIYVHFSMWRPRANAHILCKLGFSFNGLFLSRVYVKLITYIAVWISFFLFLLPNLSHTPNLSFLVETKRNEWIYRIERMRAKTTRANLLNVYLQQQHQKIYYECHKRLCVCCFTTRLLEFQLQTVEEHWCCVYFIFFFFSSFIELNSLRPLKF